MKLKHLISLTFIILFAANSLTHAQDKYEQWRTSWIEKANQSVPQLIEEIKHPISIVSPIADKAAYQGWRMEKKSDITAFYNASVRQNSGTIIDFGEHITGYVTFSTEWISLYPDSPVRLKFTFGEMPCEVAESFDSYETANTGMSRAWLQDEIVTINEIPSTITIPRRMSFRYVKIELVHGGNFDFKISNMQCTATTSAKDWPEPLPATTDPLLQKINQVSLTTLKECMQTVYEDGPKRDRRLWIGDLYLEAKANMYSFKNHELTRHCLYAIAAMAAKDGLLTACIFERPFLHPSKDQIADYSLLYNATLLDYVRATGDKETALDLWPVVKEQIAYNQRYLEDNYIYNPRKERPLWIFFDWAPGLDNHVSIQGVMIYSLEQSYELAKLIGKEKEVAEWPMIAREMKKAIKKTNYDKKQGVFFSGPEKQLSYISQIWMIISGVLNEKEGQKALKTVLADKSAMYPGTPYAWHYLIEAMISCGMHKEAKETLIEYWGGMVKKGADTFWEAYDPNNDYRSPYNYHPLNSYCHAWSCTPVYFIQKYPEVFQK